MTNKINKILKELKTTLGNEVWMVFGGYNLKLQGLNYQTNDIDIYTTLNGLSKIKKKYKCTFKCGYNWAGVDFRIKRQEFQAISEELSTKSYYSKYLNKRGIKSIKLGNITIPCLKLENQIRGYQAVMKAGKGSTDPKNKIVLIRKYLSKS